MTTVLLTTRQRAVRARDVATVTGAGAEERSVVAQRTTRRRRFVLAVHSPSGSWQWSSTLARRRRAASRSLRSGTPHVGLTARLFRRATAAANNQPPKGRHHR
jgi:hypothetical protein